jgi:hypothetical protein
VKTYASTPGFWKAIAKVRSSTAPGWRTSWYHVTGCLDGPAPTPATTGREPVVRPTDDPRLSVAQDGAVDPRDVATPCIGGAAAGHASKTAGVQTGAPALGTKLTLIGPDGTVCPHWVKCECREVVAMSVYIAPMVTRTAVQALAESALPMAPVEGRSKRLQPIPPRFPRRFRRSTGDQQEKQGSADLDWIEC